VDDIGVNNNELQFSRTDQTASRHYQSEQEVYDEFENIINDFKAASAIFRQAGILDF